MTAPLDMIGKTEEVKRIIRQHSLEELPGECCGLIIQNSYGDIEVFKCENSAQDKIHNFAISAEDYLIATSTGNILAMYHSHPQGEPEFSEADKATSNGHKIYSLLYHMETDQFLEYPPK